MADTCPSCGTVDLLDDLEQAAADAVRMARELRDIRDVVSMALSEDNPRHVVEILLSHLDCLTDGDRTWVTEGGAQTQTVIDRWSMAEPRTKTCSSTEGIRP